MTNSLSGALPSGSLQKPCMELWASAGYKIRVEERSCHPTVDDPDLNLILLRSQDIPRYVANGKLDFGICGYDCTVEAGCVEDVVEMSELIFSKVSRVPIKWVLAVKADSAIQNIGDLQGKLIQTEFAGMTRRWLREQNVEATVEFSWGTTEVKAGRFCDAIVEATETGNSLRKNGLRIVAEVLQSTPRFIASKAAYDDPWKREKMEDIVLMLKGALDAEGKVWLTFNLPADNLPTVVQILPALQAPTISPLAGEGWVSLNTIIDEAVVRTIIPKLKRAGAVHIVESPISKLIP